MSWLLPTFVPACDPRMEVQAGMVYVYVHKGVGPSLGWVACSGARRRWQTASREDVH